MFADRLKIARKKAGLSLRGLAERLDPPVSAQAISKYEASEMTPSSAVLVGLAKALDTSVDFLMSAEVAQLESVEFRKHSGTSAQDRARVEAIVTEKLENIFAIEDVLGIGGIGEEPDAFEGLRAENVSSLEEAEQLAERLRAAWNLGGDAVPGLTGVLEDKGLRVIEAELPERMSGMACHVRWAARQDEISVIVVSSTINTER
jgi:transcriptional regulator with XRE-family HTH domain